MECLQNAVQLYKLSVEFQRHGSRWQRAHGRLLLLSCVNNLASAYGLLGDKKSEKRTHRKLLTTLMYLSYKQRFQQQGQQQQQQHKYESFFRNVFKEDSSNTALA